MDAFLQKIHELFETKTGKFMGDSSFWYAIENGERYDTHSTFEEKKAKYKDILVRSEDLNLGDLYFDLFEGFDTKDIFMVVHGGKKKVVRVAESPFHSCYHFDSTVNDIRIKYPFSSYAIKITKAQFEVIVNRGKFRIRVDPFLLNLEKLKSELDDFRREEVYPEEEFWDRFIKV